MPSRPSATGSAAPRGALPRHDAARCSGLAGEAVLALAPLPTARGAALFVQRAAGREARLRAERRR